MPLQTTIIPIYLPLYTDTPPSFNTATTRKKNKLTILVCADNNNPTGWSLSYPSSSQHCDVVLHKLLQTSQLQILRRSWDGFVSSITFCLWLVSNSVARDNAVSISCGDLTPTDWDTLGTRVMTCQTFRGSCRFYKNKRQKSQGNQQMFYLLYSLPFASSLTFKIRYGLMSQAHVVKGFTWQEPDQCFFTTVFPGSRPSNRRPNEEEVV